MRNEAIIAVVDNDESVRMALDSLLRSSGYNVRTYAGAREFISSNEPGTSSCLICDIQMPDMDGVSLYEELASLGIHIPVIFITGNPDAMRPPGPHTLKPIACFSKPFSTKKLLASVETALGRSN
ncbi:response regulator transcription factor [Pseudomonas sp. NPDC089569]|uniref:response regulator transcription factor n=1 Tax=Pseudomonas sp. NPDC089569 TaxID=3390722 RepID=UPI003D00512B